MKKSLLLIAFTFLVFNISCNKSPTSSTNTAPTASFTVDPTSGTTATTFTFDASGSSDIVYHASELVVRWDWENDGTYDTDYSTNKTATHQFISAGTYIVLLQIQCDWGYTYTTTQTVYVTESDDYTLSDNVIILDSLTTPEPIIQGDLYTFNYTTTPPDFKVGDILIGYTNGGYMGKITGLQKPSSSNSFVVKLILTRIFLDEVFEDCDFDIPIQVFSNDISLDNTTLFNQQHNGIDLDVTIQDGFINTDLDVNFRLLRVDGETLEFGLVATGGVDFEAETKFVVNAQIDDFRDETLIIPPLAFPFAIGPVPALINLGFYGGFLANISTNSELSYQCSAYGSLAVGAEYTNTGGWNGIWDPFGDFTNEAVEWDVDVNADVEVYVKLELSVLVAGLAGPFINFQPYLNLETNINYPQWNWYLYGGYRGNLGFEVNALGFLEIIDFTPTPLTQWETQIASDSGGNAQYSLSINTTGNGSVSRSPDKSFYNAGESVQLTATPSSGWSFTNWEGDLQGSNNPTSIIMNSNKSVTAVFTQNATYSLNINISGNGSVSKSPNKTYYNYGESVQLIATPSSGWSFSNWQGDLNGFFNPTTITMDGNKSVTAVFAENNQNTIVIQPGPTDGKDAYVRHYYFTATNSSWTESNMHFPQINIGITTIGTNIDSNEALIEFPISQIPTNKNIISASLYVYSDNPINSSNYPVTIYLSKLTESWSKSYVSWDTKPSSTQPISSISLSTGSDANNKWLEFEITSLVQAWVNGEANYGIKLSGSYSGCGIIINSSENLNTSERPKLIVKY